MTDQEVHTSYLIPPVARVHLIALLPNPDGVGWYAVQERERPHECSKHRCTGRGVAYFLYRDIGSRRSWRRKYYCDDHLADLQDLVIMGGRVWLNKEHDAAAKVVVDLAEEEPELPAVEDEAC